MHNLCCIITCLGALVSLVLVIWVLVKQHKCCKSEPFHGAPRFKRKNYSGMSYNCHQGKCTPSPQGKYGSHAECNNACRRNSGPCANGCNC